LLNLRLEREGANLTLTWDPVPGAARYRVYGSETSPTTGFRLLNTTTHTSYSLPLHLPREFFRVTVIWEE
jgi:hypothetical protein